MLYIVATPIGNLGELTYRATEVLNSVEYILCEDTRTSQVLLNKYDIELVPGTVIEAADRCSNVTTYVVQ